MTLTVLDRAIQVHGAAGVTQFTPLAEMYAHQRTLRIADGPDEVREMTIARREIQLHAPDFRSGNGPRPARTAVEPQVIAAPDPRAQNVDRSPGVMARPRGRGEVRTR